MPKKIDHEERKEKILSTALKVFSQYGYKDSNLSLIAEKSGISRPTIYQYFHDKNEIFYFAVKSVTGRMFSRYSMMAWDESIGDEIDRLEAIISDVIDTAKANEDALINLMDVMIAVRKEDGDLSDVIFRRTAKLTILLKRLIVKGINSGVIKQCDHDDIADYIFITLESFCFQIAFFRVFEKQEAMAFIRSYLDFYRVRT